MPLSPPEKAKDDILLFFKLYDPKEEDIRYQILSSSFLHLHGSCFDDL